MRYKAIGVAALFLLIVVFKNAFADVATNRNETEHKIFLRDGVRAGSFNFLNIESPADKSNHGYIIGWESSGVTKSKKSFVNARLMYSLGDISYDQLSANMLFPVGKTKGELSKAKPVLIDPESESGKLTIDPVKGLYIGYGLGLSYKSYTDVLENHNTKWSFDANAAIKYVFSKHFDIEALYVVDEKAIILSVGFRNPFYFNFKHPF